MVISQALWQLSTVEVAAGIRARRFSCSEVMVSVVERIRTLNPKLNAIVVDLTEQALPRQLLPIARLLPTRDRFSVSPSPLR